MKIGVIGCGKQGIKHIRALKAFSDIQILVMDENWQLANDVAQAEKVAPVRDMYETTAVFICTPIQRHHSLICSILKRKMHVFCEKPLCEDIPAAKNIEALMIENNRFVQVGYVYRYAPVFEEIHRILHETSILGEPLFALFRLGGRGSHQEWKHKKELGGGAINEMLVHMLDLAVWFFGPLKSIGVLDNRVKLRERMIGDSKVACNAEDFVFLKCKNNQGVDIFIEADFITPAFSQYVEIQGGNGSFFGSIQPDIFSYLYLKEPRGGYEAGKTVFNFGKRNFFDAQVTDFIYSVALNKWPTKNTVSDSILLMKVLEGIRA